MLSDGVDDEISGCLVSRLSRGWERFAGGCGGFLSISAVAEEEAGEVEIFFVSETDAFRLRLRPFSS